MLREGEALCKCQVLWEAWVIAMPKVPSDGWEIKQRSPLQLLINNSVAFFMTEIFPGNWRWTPDQDLSFFFFQLLASKNWMQCWKPVWAMKNTNLKVTDGKRIMMDPVNNNFLSYNFFWLWHYTASWKAELISGLYHGLSVWCEIRSYRSTLLILDAWLDSPEMILSWLFFQCLCWPCLGLDLVLGLSRGLEALLASS